MNAAVDRERSLVVVLLSESNCQALQAQLLGFSRDGQAPGIYRLTESEWYLGIHVAADGEGELGRIRVGVALSTEPQMVLVKFSSSALGSLLERLAASQDGRSDPWRLRHRTAGRC